MSDERDKLEAGIAERLERIEEARADIKVLQKKVDAYDWNEDEQVLDRYHDMLQESLLSALGDADLGFWKWILTGGNSAATLLQEHDPILYRCDLNDYVDSLQKDDFVPEDLQEILDEIEELEEEIESLESDNEYDQEELDGLEEDDE